jgi:effector-binding domain-containing protein
MEYKLKDVDVEAAVPITGPLHQTGSVKVREIPEVEKAACLVHKGPYETSMTAYRSLIGWLFTSGYQLAAANREIYIKGPHDTTDPRNYITELQFPIIGW